MKAISLSCTPKSNLTVIATTYYFRQVVPADLRGQVQQSVFRVSLRTSDKRKATHKASFLYAMMWQMFTSLRRRDKDMEPLTANQIKRLVAEWINEALDTEERTLATRGHTFRFKDERGNDITAEKNAESLSYLAADRREQLINCDYRAVEDKADQLLINKGLPIDRHSDAYKLLCRELLKADTLQLNIMAERYMGNYNSRYDVQRRIMTMESRPRGSRQSLNDSSNSSTAISNSDDTLSVFVRKYIDYHIAEKAWTPQTAFMNESKFNFFVEIMGNPKLKEITQDMLTKARLLLFKYPKNKTTSKKYKSWSLAKIKTTEIPEKERMSTKTIETYCSQVNALFSWTQNFYNAPAWLTKIILPPKRNVNVQTNKARDIFSHEDLEKIFHDKTVVNASHSYRFWLPLLGLYTGAREEELCQLYLSDFLLVDGFPCISINAFDENRNEVKWIKNKFSIRTFPIHPQLLELGLWERVQAMKEAGKTRLFEEIKPTGKWQKCHKYFCKVFNDRLRKIGIDNTGEGKKVFYSFRHSYINYCAQERLDAELREVIAGHMVDTGGISWEHYIKGIKPSVLYAHIVSKIDYGIDLSHLKGHEYTRYDG